MTNSKFQRINEMRAARKNEGRLFHIFFAFCFVSALAIIGLVITALVLVILHYWPA